MIPEPDYDALLRANHGWARLYEDILNAAYEHPVPVQDSIVEQIDLVGKRYEEDGSES